MRTLFIAAILGLISATSYGQAQKIGFADWSYIFSQMPEMKQIDNELKTHGTQLENQLKAKSQELEAKYKAYQGMPATTPDAIRADKERELQQMQESIQKFQQDAQTSLQNKQTSLMEPIYKKVGKAIEDVAKENGYSFIINPQLFSGDDIMLYGDEQYNISNLVLKKLGITPSPAANSNQPVKN